MSRPRSADPKSVKIGVAVTEAVAAELDAQRGDMKRSPFVEGLIIAFLTTAPVNGGPPAVRPAVRKATPKTKRTAGPTAKPDAARVVPFSAVDTGNCPHPKARVHKGLCGACGVNVGAK